MAQERVESPLAGKILRVNASVGNHVNEGDAICVIESLKMENDIVAPVSGKVTELNVSPEQVVQATDVLAVIEY